MARSTLAIAALVAIAGAVTSTTALAQKYPITNAQRDTANQVAQKGVPLSELAADAPDSYTINVPDGWELHVDGQPNTDSNTLTLGHFAILREPGASFALRIELVERSRRAFGLATE